MRLLVGDIGGTSTRLALAAVTADGAVSLSDEHRYPSASAPDLDTLVRDWRARTGATVTRASLAIAGPVAHNRCHTTNLPWTVDGDALAAATGLASATLLNDFAAAAWGTLAVDDSARVALQSGRFDASAPRVVIGAGTGLGEALVVTGDGGTRVLPGEGGHAGFAPRDAREDRLLAWMRRELGGRVSVERVVSGLGLREIYRFLRDEEGAAESPAVRARMASEDPGAVIGACAVDGSDALCGATLDLFLGAYGAVAGDAAIRTLAYGGVFLAGGIAAKVLPRLVGGGFLAAFTDKGRMRAIAEAVPVWVVTDGALGLRGAARAAA
ncbi:MAG: Glucokinase [Myxococcaceae bacterium]|nr:Glucokinase [Myxococcaceae bacterium]